MHFANCVGYRIELNTFNPSQFDKLARMVFNCSKKARSQPPRHSDLLIGLQIHHIDLVVTVAVTLKSEL